jgi:hypothetical protein
VDRLIVARKLDSLRRCLVRVRERCPADVAILAANHQPAASRISLDM